MGTLQVLLCGSPEVRLDGQPLPISRRTPRAILFYLASQGGMVGRDQLLALFWEDQGESAARRRLTDSLSRLRLELPDPEVLLTDTSLVGLDFTQVYVDQLEFTNLLDQAGRLPWQIPANDPLPKHTYELLHNAATLWRSPGFLIGANFPSSVALDEWLTHTTQSMEHQLGRVLDRLAKHAQAIGDLERALQLMRQCLHLDELDEDTNYRILRFLIDLGYQNEAREHFNRYQTLMRQELDTSPSSRLVDLYRRVRNGKAAPTRVESSPLWKVRPSVQVPFVGRDTNLEQLHRAYQTGRPVFIFGESGQGKTRLLQEFTTNLSPQPRVIVTTCRPAEVNLPFQPLVELLRYQILAEEWLTLPAVWASQLSLLLPELMEMRPDLTRPALEASPEAAPGLARGALLEAIRQVFVLVSRDQRLVICIDDAHWADEATLETVAYLLDRAPFNRQALLLVAARWEESNPHLEALLSTLQPANQTIVMPLARLDEGDISELASFVFGQSPSALFTHQLYQKTDGNPFVLLESLRSLVEREPHQDLSTLEKLPVVRSVEILITSRLNKLPARTRSVLEVAAVIGTDFDPEILAQVIELTPLEVAAELDELSKRYLIESVDHSPENLRQRFLHETIRDTLLQTINPLRARLLHAQVARALQASAPTGDQAAILAQHYESAGDLVPAFDYWLSAGKRARRLLSTSDAAWSFERASSLIEHTPQLTDQQIHDLYSEWTEAAYEAEDDDTIRRINSDLLQLGQERKSPLLIGTALNGLGDASMISDQFEEGLDYTTQAIKFLEIASNPFQLMQAFNHRGVFLYMLNHIDESIEAFQDVLSLSVDSHDARLIQARANAHYQIAVARILVGMPETAQNHAMRALADYINIQHTHGQITAYSALALARYFLGKYEQAFKDCQQGIELAQQLNSWRILGYLHAYQSMVEMSRGHLDGTVQHALQAIQIGDSYHHSEISSTGYRVLGDIYFWTFHYRKSVDMYARAVQLSENRFLTTDSQYRLGVAMYLDGNTGPGKKILYGAIENAEQSGQQLIWVLAKIAELMVTVVDGSWNQVKELHAVIEEQVRRRTMPELSLIINLLLVEKAIQVHEEEIALRVALESARHAATLAHPWLEMRSLLAAQQVLQKTAAPDASIRQRILEILDQFEKHATIQPYCRALQAYAKMVRLQLV